jgi:hypothetical protein
MIIRPFDWRDLPALQRNRKNSVYLHSLVRLTRGVQLLSGAIISSFASSSGIFTSVSLNNGDTKDPLIGQITHPSGSQLAHLSFLTPNGALASDGLSGLLEHLSDQVTERGAFRVLADVDEQTSAYSALRMHCFAIYARQRIWRLSAPASNETGSMAWQTVNDQDLIPVKSLYANLVPGLVQQVEPFPEERLQGLVYRQGTDVLAFVELAYGPVGIWAQPFVHPDAENVATELLVLLRNLPDRRSRPVYLCVRSYQSWLESVVEEIGGEPSPRQAVMVKHLAAPQKATRTFAVPALEGGQPEVTTPIVHTDP